MALAALALAALRLHAADDVEIPFELDTYPGIRPPRDSVAPRDTTWNVAGGCVAVRGPMGLGGVTGRHTKGMIAVGFDRGPNGVLERGLGDDGALGPTTVTWAISDTAWDARSGVHALTDSPNGMYAPNWSNSASIGTVLDLTNAHEASLRFWHHWSLRYNSSIDSAIVRIRSNGGPWIAHRVFTNTGGFVGSFLPETIDLAVFVGSVIEIGFGLETSAASNDDGWVVDDVVIDADGEILFADDFESGTDGWVLENAWGLTTPFTSLVTTTRSESIVTFPVSRDRFGTPLATVDATGLVTTNPVGLPTFVGEGIGFLWVVAGEGAGRRGTMVRVSAPGFVPE